MKVEIWSDVMCPFCYIGKRKFEQALAQFPHADAVEIEWKSFQLNPDMVTDPSLNVIAYLAEQKGWSLDHSRKMHDHVINMANEVGLTYNFEKAVVANSFDAHRLLQYAKASGKGDAIEERLFKAYFTEGQNIADLQVLQKLAEEVGLPGEDVKAILATKALAEGVRRDIQEAQQIGVQGVPFFVFDRKFAVSGAQQPEVFLGALNKAWEEGQKSKPKLQVQPSTNGPACTPEGECD